MKKRELIKIFIVGIIILSIFVVIIILLGKNSESNKINLNETTNNYVVNNDMAMDLYYRFNPENELLFNVVGNDYDEDNFAYYYRNRNVKYEDLTDDIKNTILFNDADYKTGKYNENKKCYYMSKDSFKAIYKKIFGKDDYVLKFSDKYIPKVVEEGNELCIGMKEEVSYNKIIDTYMINVIEDDNNISIYEKVAFIKITDEFLYFYSDYQMKNLVYRLKVSNDLDMSFVNNPKVVSNVLLRYLNDFDLYEFKYVEGEDSYYFESINR